MAMIDVYIRFQSSKLISCSEFSNCALVMQNFQLGASCRSCLLCFPLVVYHLILWGHRMMKVQMKLVLFRYIPVYIDGCWLFSSPQFLI